MSSRTTLINKVIKVARRHYEPFSPPADRTLLEHLLYACCLEDAPVEAADEAYAKLQETFFDWNEIRVTTVIELAETMSSLPEAGPAATRLKKCLQQIFEGNYSYDIDYLKKQNLGKAIKELEELRGATPFVLAYITQHGLSGHAIPTSRGLLDVMLIVGVISPAEAEKGRVPGLERAVPKAKGIEHASLLHQLGVDYSLCPQAARILSILAEIDPGVKDRLPLRPGESGDAATESRTKKARARSQSGSAASGEAADTRKTRTTKKSATGSTDAKRSPTKQLTKKKPR